MQVDPEAAADITKRLRQADGQIRGVIAMLESGHDRTEVVAQLSAVSRALDRAGFKVIASGLGQCLSADDEKQRTGAVTRLERLFLSLA